MQPLGILFLTAGIWLIYCGVTGVPPVQTMQKIIANPAQATEIIAAAKAENALQITGAVDGGLKAAFTGTNPFAGWKIGGDFAAHKARGSQGGTDFPIPVGTPIPSPFAGVVHNFPNAGAQGNMVSLQLDNGWKFQALHLSRFRDDLNGKRVTPGTIIGYTGGAKGAPGAGSSTGPHLHIHMRDTRDVVQDYMAYIASANSKGAA